MPRNPKDIAGGQLQRFLTLIQVSLSLHPLHQNQNLNILGVGIPLFFTSLPQISRLGEWNWQWLGRPLVETQATGFSIKSLSVIGTDLTSFATRSVVEQILKWPPKTPNCSPRLWIWWSSMPGLIDHKELCSANNLNEPVSRFLPRASK